MGDQHGVAGFLFDVVEARVQRGIGVSVFVVLVGLATTSGNEFITKDAHVSSEFRQVDAAGQKFQDHASI